MKNALISIVVIVKNEERYIKRCLDALRGQSFPDFEIIIIDNGSTDGTKEIVNSFRDTRTHYFYEPGSLGIAALRNFGIEKSSGEYIFFTDGDCAPDLHWLENGLNVLASGKYSGVEGKTYYEYRNKITVRDYNTHQFIPGEFMTCNMAYLRSAIEKAGYFDERFKNGHEDKAMARSVLKSGEIFFSPDMVVFHQNKKMGIKTLFNRAKRVTDMVAFIKEYGKCDSMYKNVLYPRRLLCIFCPVLLLLGDSFGSLHDLVFGFFLYLSFIYERILIWRAAVRHRIFVV